MTQEPTKRKRGRPKKTISPSQLPEIERMAGLGLSEQKIAVILGLSVPTFIARKQDDPRIGLAIEKGRADAEEKIGQTLYDKALGGDLGSIVWWEKTRAGRFERRREEHTGKDGGPITTKADTDDSGELLSRLDRLATRSGAAPDRGGSNGKTAHAVAE